MSSSSIESTRFDSAGKKKLRVASSFGFVLTLLASLRFLCLLLFLLRQRSTKIVRKAASLEGALESEPLMSYVQAINFH